jgi:hypothetical protein
MLTWRALRVTRAGAMAGSRHHAHHVTLNRLTILVQTALNVIPPAIGTHLSIILAAAMEIVQTIEMHPAQIATHQAILLPPASNVTPAITLATKGGFMDS